MFEKRILRTFHFILMYTYLFFTFDAPHCSKVKKYFEARNALPHKQKNKQRRKNNV